MNRLTATIVALAVIALAACTGQTEPATNIKAGTVDLNAKASAAAGESGAYWFEFRKQGAQAWTATQLRSWEGPFNNISFPERLRTDCTGIALCSDRRLASQTTYQFRLCGVQHGLAGIHCWDGNGTYGGTSYDTFTTGARPKVFPILYLWTQEDWWRGKLGTQYPLDDPWPLPGTMLAQGNDTDRRCATQTSYAGNQLTDVSPDLAFSVEKPGVIEDAVQQAADRGFAGFMVNWSNTVGDNAKLQRALDKAAEVTFLGQEFKIILDFKTNAGQVSMDSIIAGLTYFADHFGNHAGLDHSFSSKPEVVVRISGGYSAADTRRLRDTLGARLYLIGDIPWQVGWDADDAYAWDANSYYWSTQDPYRNTGSFGQLSGLADEIRAAGDKWIAPFTPGYNDVLLDNGSDFCIERTHADGRETYRVLFNGNKESLPNAWSLISWNEIGEGTHVVPLKRWGDSYLDKLEALLAEQ